MNARHASVATLLILLPACARQAPHGAEPAPSDGSTASPSSEIAKCAPEACGPALGMPAVVCADGSSGGNTGHCVRANKTAACGWEIRECPRPSGLDCSAPRACGPALGMPNRLCADGKTMSGPSGRCLDKGGACGWEILNCPP